MADLSEKLIRAAIDRYNADKTEALVSIQLLLDNSVGIGDHSNILNEINKWVGSLSEAEDKIKSLESNFSHLLSCN